MYMYIIYTLHYVYMNAGTVYEGRGSLVAVEMLL
jgi:hypothetical protein